MTKDRGRHLLGTRDYALGTFIFRISNCEMRIGKNKEPRAPGVMSVVRGPWSIVKEAWRNAQGVRRKAQGKGQGQRSDFGFRNAERELEN